MRRLNLALPVLAALAFAACGDHPVAPPHAAVGGPGFTHTPMPDPAWTPVAGGPPLMTAVASLRGGLRDVYVAPNGVAYGVGPQGEFIAWNGSTTTQLAPIDRRTWLYGVWARPNGEVIAVGAEGRAYHWRANVFSNRPTVASILYDVYGATADIVYAVGSHVLRYNGVVWTRVYTPSQTLRGVWASGPNDVWAVGSGIIVHFDGVSWTETTGLGARNAVSGTGPSDVWADSPAGLLHYDGTSWSLAAPGVTGAGIWAAAPNDVWVVGGGVQDSDEYVWHFDGSSWTQIVPVGSTSYHRFFGVHGRDGRLLLAGANGLVQRFAGGNLPNFVSDLESVWGVSSQLAYAVGAGGTLLRYSGDGDGWTRLTLPTTAALTGVWGSHDFNVHAVGQNGTLLVRGGSSVWSVEPSPTTRHLHAVWGAPGVVFAVGDGGTVLRREAGIWTRVPLSLTTDLLDVAGGSARNVFAVGTGTVLHFDGIRWNRRASPTTGLLDAVWHDGRGGLYVGSSGCCGAGGVWKSESGGWTRLLTEPVADIGGSGSQDVFFVGGRRVWLYDGATLRPLEVEPVRTTHTDALRGVWAHGEGKRVYVVGRGGVILRGTR